MAQTYDLRDLQERLKAWVAYNFTDRQGRFKDPRGVPYHPLLGVVEEVGELAEVLIPASLSLYLGRLAHATLKQEQGIRGTAEDLEAQAQDAIADLVIFLMDLCAARGWDFAEILFSTAEEVLKRDWIRYPATGRPLE